ncbi:MAG TPA: hypothetical protein VFI23_04375 [Rhizomicrobium sp.]|nr:hypothetical protein [Rhizomicrobium sp.]
MKLSLLAAGLLLCSAIVSPVLSVTLTLSPPPKVLPPAAPKPVPTQAAPKAEVKTEAKAECPCPKAQPAKTQTHAVRRRHYAGGSYRYADAVPFRPLWPQSAGSDAYVPARNLAYEQGLHIDEGGWTGGVGYGAEGGGGGGGYGDGYGQVHFANGAENGPTYNSYNQSFQFNPSQPGPFQPRLMGGFAPRSQ